MSFFKRKSGEKPLTIMLLGNLHHSLAMPCLAPKQDFHCPLAIAATIKAEHASSKTRARATQREHPMSKTSHSQNESTADKRHHKLPAIYPPNKQHFISKQHLISRIAMDQNIERS